MSGSFQLNPPFVDDIVISMVERPAAAQEMSYLECDYITRALKIWLVQEAEAAVGKSTYGALHIGPFAACARNF